MLKTKDSPESGVPGALSVGMLEARFGSDDALGVRLDPVDGDDAVSVFPDGSSAVCCTNYAQQVKLLLPGHEVLIVGFSNQDNPQCAAVIEEWHPGGHDFALVDGRFLVDAWAKLVANTRRRVAYDLQDDQDARIAALTYGDPMRWSALTKAGPFTRDWDRSGLKRVMACGKVQREREREISEIASAGFEETRDDDGSPGSDMGDLLRNFRSGMF